ncbi:hypothetical protein [Geodermatophilus sp. SYSU D00710]
MRRFRFLLVLLLALAAPIVSASAAAAQTTVFVSMTFAEPVHPNTDCPAFPDSSCGSGQVIPLGRATSEIVFGAGCGGTCDIRTIYLADGTIILEETSSPGECVAEPACFPGPIEVRRSTLTSVVIGGTGAYEGVTGTLTGTVRFSISNARPAGAAIVKLSGTISY